MRLRERFFEQRIDVERGNHIADLIQLHDQDTPEIKGTRILKAVDRFRSEHTGRIYKIFLFHYSRQLCNYKTTITKIILFLCNIATNTCKENFCSTWY